MVHLNKKRPAGILAGLFKTFDRQEDFMVDVFRLNIDALKENYLPLARFFENLNENTGNESSVILETSKSGMRISG